MLSCLLFNSQPHSIYSLRHAWTLCSHTFSTPRVTLNIKQARGPWHVNKHTDAAQWAGVGFVGTCHLHLHWDLFTQCQCYWLTGVQASIGQLPRHERKENFSGNWHQRRAQPGVFVCRSSSVDCRWRNCSLDLFTSLALFSEQWQTCFHSLDRWIFCRSCWFINTCWGWCSRFRPCK